MKDLNTVLREADPAADDAGLSPVEIAAMRRAVLAAAHPPAVLTTPWQRPLAVAAMVALTLAGGVIAGRYLPPPEVPAGSPVMIPVQEGERRQLQFATPGGTRIIWVFDSEFDLKETTP
jgi:hypothetical protein